MVLPLLALPPELQAVVVKKVTDTATAGRLAQASRASYRLGTRRLVEIREERRLAALARMAAQQQRKREALLELFEEVDGGACYRCKAHTMTGGTPRGSLLRTRAGRYVAPILMKHLQCCHAAEYSALKMMMDAL